MAAAAVTRPEGRRGRPLGVPRSACTAGAVSSLPRCDKRAWGGLLQVWLWLGPVLLEVGWYAPTAQTSSVETAATAPLSPMSRVGRVRAVHVHPAAAPGALAC